MVVVTKKELANIGKHSYAATDKSILGPYMQHYWNWALQFVPLKTHPNVVTYTGFLWLTTAVLIIGYFDFVHSFGGQPFESYLNGTATKSAAQAATTNAPWWAWVWAAIAIFMYQTFDALDGKQARRIKAGSSVGEIVDHSADAVTTIFVQYLLTSAVFRDTPMRGFILTMFVFVGFFTSHWEHYVTHVFYLGHMNGPTEGLVLTSIFFLLTGTFGSAVWSDPAYYHLPRVEINAPPAIAPYLPVAFRDVKITKNSDVLFYLTLFSAIMTVVPSVIKTVVCVIQKSLNNISSPVRKNPATHPPVRAYEALARTALPFFYLCALATDYIFEFRNFHINNFFLVEVALGWVTSLAATRVTVRRLTGAPYGFCTVSYFTTFLGLVLPLLALKGNAVFGPNAPADGLIAKYVCPCVAQLFVSKELQWFADEHNQRLMWIAICVIGGIEYVHYCWRLLWLMAKHLGINLLVLTPAQSAYVDAMADELRKAKVK